MTGSGTAATRPDALRFAVALEVRGATPAEALTACGVVQDAVLAVLDVAGAQDLRPGGLQVQPGWDPEHDRPGRPQATSRLSALLPDPAEAGAVVEAALQAGGEAVRVEGLSPVVRDPGPVLVQAREAAWRDALATATQYADLAGASLGAVLEVREGDGTTRFEVLASRRGGSYDPVGGDADVAAAVTVTWALTGR